MEISSKGVTICLTLSTRRIQNNKHKEGNTNNEVVSKYFMKIIEEFKDIPYLGYWNRKVKHYARR